MVCGLVALVVEGIIRLARFLWRTKQAQAQANVVQEDEPAEPFPDIKDRHDGLPGAPPL